MGVLHDVAVLGRKRYVRQDVESSVMRFNGYLGCVSHFGADTKYGMWSAAFCCAWFFSFSFEERLLFAIVLVAMYSETAYLKASG